MCSAGQTIALTEDHKPEDAREIAYATLERKTYRQTEMDKWRGEGEEEEEEVQERWIYIYTSAPTLPFRTHTHTHTHTRARSLSLYVPLSSSLRTRFISAVFTVFAG